MKEDKRHGPVTLEVMESMLQSGYLARTDLVWREGMKNWSAARDVPVLMTGSRQSPTSGTQRNQPLAAVNTPITVAQPSEPNSIPNYMVPAVLATLFCSPIFGIPAIVNASKVNSLVSQGNIPEAIEASNKAKKWAWIAFGVGFVVFLLYFVAGMSEGL